MRTMQFINLLCSAYVCLLASLILFALFDEYYFDHLYRACVRNVRPLLPPPSPPPINSNSSLKSTVYFNRPMKCSRRSVEHFTMQLHTGANDTYILEINKPQQTLCERNNTNSVSRCYFRTLLPHKLFKIHTHTHTNVCVYMTYDTVYIVRLAYCRRYKIL